MVYCETYYEIAIYSNCTGKANRTQLNIDAGLVSDFNREMKKSVQSYYKIKSHTKDEFTYQVYDVCDNFTLIVELVQNLILDENFQIQDQKKYSKSSMVAFFV